MAMDTTKVLEGIELVDAELESLAARQAELEAKAASLAAATEATAASLAEVQAAHEARAAMPSVEERAVALIAALEAAGCSEATVRVALTAQFGKKAPPAAALPLKPPSALKEKPITQGLPSDERQAEILAAVEAAGAKGIRMEELYEKFGAVEPNDKVAVFGTVKNATLANKVVRSGQARGMRYNWAV